MSRSSEKLDKEVFDQLLLALINMAIDTASERSTHEHDKYAKCVDELFKAKAVI